MAADPYLAVTLDAKRRIARAALAIGADPAAWTLGYLNLMEHVWERKDARVSALVIAACFGPDPRAPAALVEFGIVVPAGEVWDLNPDDTDRLLLTYKQRVAAGKARAASAARDEMGRVQRATSGQPAEHQRTSSGPPAASQLLHPAPSTQQKEEDLPRAPPAGEFALEEQRQKRTRKHSRQEVLYTALSARRREVLGAECLPDPWTIQRQNERLGGEILDCDPDLLLAALQRFLESPFSGKCDPPGALGAFVSQWSRWVSDAMRSNAVGEK